MSIWIARDSVNKGFDTLSKFAQILALIITGFWVFNTDRLTVQPGLQFRGNVENSLEWSDSADPQHCFLTMKVLIENKGMKSFTVKSMHVQGWLYPSDPGKEGLVFATKEKLSPTDPVRVNYEAIASRRAFYDRSFSQFNRDTVAALIDIYPPGTSSEEAWDWSFQRNAGEAVLFKVDVETTDSKVVIPTAWQSEDVCSVRKPDDKVKP